MFLFPSELQVLMKRKHNCTEMKPFKTRTNGYEECTGSITIISVSLFAKHLIRKQRLLLNVIDAFFLKSQTVNF